MPTINAIRAAEETLRMARITVDLVKPGDVVIIHKARPREVVCSLSFVATIVSTRDTQPDLIYPPEHLWEVTVTLDTGETEVFRCSGKYTLLLATEPDVPAAALGRKVAEALEAAGCGLLGETERLAIYRVLRGEA